MKRLILASLAGILAACGGQTPPSPDAPPQQADAGTEVGRADVGPADGSTGTPDLAPAVDWPADSPFIADVGALDAGALDVGALDAGAPDAGALDAGAVGQRPWPIDGSSAACEDRVLSYDDKVLGAYMSSVNSLAFSPDGQVLSAGIEHSMASWQVGGADGGAADGGGVADGGGGVDGGTCSGIVRTCPAGIYSLAYLPDGRLVGLYCGGQFIIFGCENVPNFLGTFAVSPVGQIVADSNSPIRLWDTTSGDVVRTMASGGASSLAFSPDGAILVGGIAGSGVRLWDVASGAELANLPIAAAGSSVLVAVSPDGRWIGALSSGRLQIWSLRTYASVATFAVDPLATSFAFTRDGGSVITGGARVNVYAVTDGSLLYQMGDRTYVVAVSPDGTRVAASGDDGVPVNLYCLY